jgi:hypothetical protein
MPDFQAGRSHTAPLEYIEVLRDPGAIAERYGQLLGSAKRELLAFAKPPYAGLVVEPAIDRGSEDAAGGPGSVRSVYEFSVFDDAEAVDMVRELIDGGEEIRFVPELPIRMAIADEAVVLVGMQDPMAAAADATIVIVEHPAMAMTMKLAFTSVWDRGLTFDQAQVLVAPTRSRARPATPTPAIPRRPMGATPH